MSGWVRVRDPERPGLVYLAHAVPAGVRFAEVTDERFPVWHTLGADEFWERFRRAEAEGAGATKSGQKRLW